MQNWIDDRRNWYLPLVGGAEMNRVKPGAIYYLTSMPYPIVEYDEFRADEVGPKRIGFSPSAAPKDTYNTYLQVGWFAMSVKIGDKDYNAGRDEYRMADMQLTKFSMTAKLTDRPIDAKTDEYRTKMDLVNITRFSALQFYVHPVVDTYQASLELKGFARK